MKKQHVVLLILELLVLASPFIKWTRDLYAVDTGRAVFDSIVLFVTMQVVLLGVAWHFALRDEVGHVRAQLRGISDRISGRSVARIRDDEFYSEFLTATRRATSRVLISYFAPDPPTEPAAPERAEYYREHAALVRQKTDVRFRRLVRDTPTNRRWVAELVREFQNLPNASLALIKDRPESEPTSLALSVQIADGQDGWLVAIQSHERESDFRDVRVTDRELVGVLEMYFNRLWGIADVVLDSGRVTDSGNRMLTQVARERA